MPSILNEIKQQKQDYINYSINKNNKQKNYLKQLTILNKNTNEISQLDYDFNKIQQDNYLWIVFNSIYLENKMIENGNKVAYFITQTLPTEYHPYHTHDRHGNKLKNFIHNKQYNSSNTINKGYKKLNNAFRSMIKDWKIDTDKYNRIYFQKVIEPHKTFIPHLHALVYIDENEAENFEKYFWNKNEQNGLGRAELTRIKDIKRSATYLTKYISKSVKPDKSNTIDIINGNMYDGWKKYNKINVYTHSRIAIPRYIFKKVSNVLRLKVNEGENILELIESLIDIHINIHYDGEIINTKITKNSGSRYIIKIDKEKVIRKDIQYEHEELHSKVLRTGYLQRLSKKYDKTIYNMWDEVEQYLYKNGDIEVIEDMLELEEDDMYNYMYDYLNENVDVSYDISYRLTSFIIYDKKYDKVIYDKNDYELFQKVAQCMTN